MEIKLIFRVIVIILISSCMSSNDSTNVVIRGHVEFEGPSVVDVNVPEGQLLEGKLDIVNCIPSAQKVVALTGRCAPNGTTIEINSPDMIPAKADCLCSNGQYSCGPVEFPGYMHNGLNPLVNILNNSFANSSTIENRVINICENDLETIITVNNNTPSESDTIIYTISTKNYGPGDVTNINIQNLLPDGITYISDNPQIGIYDSLTGDWNIPEIKNGEIYTLEITSKVGTVLNGEVITNEISNVELDQIDGSNSNDILSVDIDVNSPVAANDIGPISFNEDTSEVVTLSYTDPDGDLATACSIVSNSSNINVSSCNCDVLGVCQVNVQGVSNFHGSSENLTYTVTASGEISNVATASFMIHAVDDTPVAANVVGSGDEDTNISVSLSYTDADGDLASSCSVTNLSNLSIVSACSCSASGVCSVIVKGSPLNFNGAASFKYSVTANSQTSLQKNAAITINAVNDPPVAINVTASGNEDENIPVSLSYTDVDGDLASSCSTSNLSNLTIVSACSCSAAGVCSVVVKGAPLNFSGSASFKYTVTANSQTSLQKNAAITINDVNDPPVAINVTASGNEDTNIPVSLSYTDTEGDLASSCSVSNLSNLSIVSACSCNAAGVCSVLVKGAPINFNGAASFKYTVTATGQTSNLANASVTITAENDAPVATNITATVAEDTNSGFINLAYTDVDGDKASSCTTSALSNLTITSACTCTATGVCRVRVKGTPDFNGAASFKYTVTATGQTSNLSNAAVTITPVNDPPSLGVILDQVMNENDTHTINVSVTDIDSPVSCSDIQPSLTTSSNTTLLPVANISIANAATGCDITFTPVTNEIGFTNIGLTLVDNGTPMPALNDTATFQLSVLDANAAPEISNFGNQSVENSYTIDIEFQITDDASLNCVSSMSHSGVDNSLIQSITFAGTAPDCIATVTPVASASGTNTNVVFTVEDSEGSTDTNTFDIEVENVSCPTGFSQLTVIPASTMTVLGGSYNSSPYQMFNEREVFYTVDILSTGVGSNILFSNNHNPTMDSLPDGCDSLSSSGVPVVLGSSSCSYGIYFDHRFYLYVEFNNGLKCRAYAPGPDISKSRRGVREPHPNGSATSYCDGSGYSDSTESDFESLTTLERQSVNEWKFFTSETSRTITLAPTDVKKLIVGLESTEDGYTCGAQVNSTGGSTTITP